MNRGHIYCRVSTEEQVEGYSLQAQERACRLYCELHGITIVDCYIDEGQSGTTAQRPQFQRMLANVQRGDVVVVHKLDRFARSTSLLLEQLNQWEQQSIRLMSVVEQIDFSSPIGKVLTTMLGAFGQYYVDNLRAETAKGHRQKALLGRWVGPVPFGYQKIDRGTLEPSADAETVREIYRLYVEEELAYGRIADVLNERGLTAYNWMNKTRGPWGRENVRVILRNRAYCGYVSAGGEEHKGNHEPLVSEAQWKAAERLREERSASPLENPPKAKLHNLYCAECGQKLKFKHTGERDDRPTTSRSYYCGRRSCTARQFSAAEIEVAAAQLASLLAVDDIREAVARLYALDGELIAVKPMSRYRQLLTALGWPIRD
jgi:site-specific DNA recombinase